MKDFTAVSPLTILRKSSDKGLGPGNLGVLIARAGAGKTACLINIAIDKIFGQKKLVHVSLEVAPEKIKSHYEVIYNNFIKALNITDDNDTFEARLLILDEYNTVALWLRSDTKHLVVVVASPKEYGFEKGSRTYTNNEFLTVLRSVRPVEGIIE